MSRHFFLMPLQTSPGLHENNEPSKYDLASQESPRTSVVRAPYRCTGGHGFDSFPHACDKLNIPTF